MGGCSEVFDIKGFEVTSKDKTCVVLESALGEEDREHLEDIDNEERIPLLTKAYDKILELPGGVEAVMACRVTGSEPMAIGWWEGFFEYATDENLEKLKQILKEAGFKVMGRLEKDRFISYG